MPRVVPSSVISYMDKTYPWLQKKENPPIGPRSPGSIRGLLTLVDRVPDELLQLDPDEFVNLIAAIERLHAGLDAELRWRNFNTEEIQSLRDLYRLLSICPDEGAPQNMAGLTFIGDEKLRESLALDFNEVNQALHNGEWKAATVLAGAVAEALLLWALQNKITVIDIELIAKKKNKKLDLQKRPLEEWFLSDLIDFAFEAALISKRTSEAATLGKDFRNLIHPGKAMRESTKCNRATALLGIGAVEAIITDLSA